MAADEQHTDLPTPILNMVGERVALGPYHQGVVPVLARWLNDFTIAIFSGDPLTPTTPEQIKEDIDHDLKENTGARRNFIIYERATLTPIGIAELRNIWPQHGSAEFGILIGEKAYWGQGMGTETTRLMLDYAFNVLNLHHIRLSTSSFNTRAQTAYQRAGFRECGRFHEVFLWGGKRYDHVLMECTAETFTSPLPSVLPELP
jgi:RimJ/RimL family protein N-acetyltransferase